MALNKKKYNTDREYPNSIPLDYRIFYNNNPDNYNNNYNDIRRLKLIILSDILGKYEFFNNMKYSDQTLMIQIIENSCLNEAIRKATEYNIHCIWSNDIFVNGYHSICYNIFTNLDIDSTVKSYSLMNMIKDNTINLNEIAKMTSIELCPEKYTIINEKINQRNNAERKLKYSELYHCRKCKKNQCTLEKRFNRSLDEGVNLTVNCLFCGHSWNA
jgi:DNA-directed RNA polymerase subunit M/transcription elongation factor TFIIS